MSRPKIVIASVPRQEQIGPSVGQGSTALPPDLLDDTGTLDVISYILSSTIPDNQSNQPSCAYRDKSFLNVSRSKIVIASVPRQEQIGPSVGQGLTALPPDLLDDTGALDVISYILSSAFLDSQSNQPSCTYLNRVSMSQCIQAQDRHRISPSTRTDWAICRPGLNGPTSRPPGRHQGRSIKSQHTNKVISPRRPWWRN